MGNLPPQTPNPVVITMEPVLQQGEAKPLEVRHESTAVRADTTGELIPSEMAHGLMTPRVLIREGPPSPETQLIFMTGMGSLQDVARRREIRPDSTTLRENTPVGRKPSEARLGFTMPVGKVWGVGGSESWSSFRSFLIKDSSTWLNRTNYL